jgi:phospholipase C
MDTRRDFIKKAALLSGGAGIWSALPASIQKALSIDPQTGSTYLDAEHIVLLMQENRSFDHTFGTLKGVRGFNDPRAINLPDSNPVWLQTNAAGETYAPFRLDIKDTKATWMSSLPHSWTNQVDARNEGKFDKWLDVKRSGHKDYGSLPLTMGYYTRADIPFYYALADAFTVCDQHFCSSLTGTTPNRLYFWTGTIRSEQHDGAYANVWNENVDLGAEVQWHSFPELLEENGVSWKIYQNEITMPMGFTDEEDAWLANFGDSPLQWFQQYNVRFSSSYIDFINKQVMALPAQIAEMEEKVRAFPPRSKEAFDLKTKLKKLLGELNTLKEEQIKYTPENYEKLSQHEKNLHEKAFSTNKKDPFYHELTSLNYKDDGVERELKVPKGDILHQFREDVKTGNLPTVSWLVAPETFSDHPSSAWYGAWYVSEVLDILTQDPETWKKTIFILTYDENDGYFDHVPPFVAPHPNNPQTGSVSKGIDTRVDYVSLDQELLKKELPVMQTRESSIGLGFRVPMVIASPWSRGGWVNSQVFDHTSCLQFLEHFLSHKSGKKMEESNISTWRRAVCGDLSSTFRPYGGEKLNTPAIQSRDAFLESIHKAQFKQIPSNFKLLTKVEIDQFKNNPHALLWAPTQEKGVRPSCSLPYQLYADGQLSRDKKTLELTFEAKNEIFGTKSAGSPFNVYAPGNYLVSGKTSNKFEPVRTWAYAVAAGDSVRDSWNLADFENGRYHLRVYGPNGFFREFLGNAEDPMIEARCDLSRDHKNNPNGNLVLSLSNLDSEHTQQLEIIDHSYKTITSEKMLGTAGKPGDRTLVVLNLSPNFGWYDFSIKISGNANFEKRYAGRIETGKESFSDPFMGS